MTADQPDERPCEPGTRTLRVGFGCLAGGIVALALVVAVGARNAFDNPVLLLALLLFPVAAVLLAAGVVRRSGGA